MPSLPDLLGEQYKKMPTCVYMCKYNRFAFIGGNKFAFV